MYVVNSGIIYILLISTTALNLDTLHLHLLSTSTLPDALLAHVDSVLVLVEGHALAVRRDQRVAPRVSRVRAQGGGELGLGAVLRIRSSIGVIISAV